MQEALDTGMPRSAVWAAAAVIVALALLGFYIGLSRALGMGGAIAPPPTTAPAATAAGGPAIVEAKPIVDPAPPPPKVDKPKKPTEEELAAQQQASALQAQQPALQVPDTSAAGTASTPSTSADSGAAQAPKPASKPSDDTPPY